MAAESSDPLAALDIDALREVAREKGWPDGMVDRAFELNVDRTYVDFWLAEEQWPLEQIQSYLERRARLILGTLRLREAEWDDHRQFGDLWGNAPEDIGDWEVTVERSPWSFAQFWLQEHVSVRVFEDKGIILGCNVFSTRNTVIGGKRTSVNMSSAIRVRKGARGQGYTRLMGGAPVRQPVAAGQYSYIRARNFDAMNWAREMGQDGLEYAPGLGDDVPGIPVPVHHFAACPLESDAVGVRRARRSDLRRCVPLINRTHRGLDLFRPYTVEYLRDRLDEGSWSEKPETWPQVYGWEDYYLLEEEDRVVACGGLWDRGRHVREVWRHKTTGERHVVENTALLDYGYAEGREDAMAGLIAHFLDLTHELGRGHLMAWVERHPKLVERFSAHDHSTETRGLVFAPALDIRGAEHLQVTQPYTDLAYW